MFFRRTVQRGQGFAEMDHRYSLDPPDQLSKDAVDGGDLGIGEMIDVRQEQARHLPQNLGIVLGPFPFGAVQLSAQVRRYGRHG